ncbi:hypothetical protein [Streptodolium elevatio]|uniref:Uncharacterized protein n=1 Tax=Streptodolium elevatio TaxID=3157996 RepID=A0ABV3DLH9_9ACTN
MYLVFALLAPIGMFGLISGLTWFEDRMLGPAVADRQVPRTPRAKPELPEHPAELPAAVRIADRVADTDTARPASAPVPEASAAEPTPPQPDPEPEPVLKPVTLESPVVLAPVALLTSPIPLQPVTAPARRPAPAPVRHRLRHTLKRGRGLRAA